MENIEYNYTDEVVCPYCGRRSSDSYEYFGQSPDEEVEIDCDCGETFIAVREVRADYSTRKKENNEMSKMRK